MINILTIVGARPQFVKAAVVSKALTDAGISEQIVHTGQHYDHEMSAVFWEELGLPVPTVNLEIGSGEHGAQTGLMMIKLEEHILKLPSLPDALLVYGDTNSTLAGSLVASKLHIPVIHVEAGLRSFNRDMPEEINRVMTDHISDLLFCSSELGVKQLAKEGIDKGVYNVGDVMYDAVLTFSEIADKKYPLHEITSLEAGEYYLATIHRPSNTDDADNLQAVLNAFSNVDQKVVWPVHPRNKKRLETMELPANLHITGPVSYFKMMVLLKNCSKVITDSGGLQKEAYWMKKQCITVRSETEWVETLAGGWNTLTGPDTGKILDALSESPSAEWVSLYGTGKTSQYIAKIIQDELN